MDHWKTVLPESAEKLDNAPPNQYMPKPENLVKMKKARDADSKPAVPQKISASTAPYEVWYKQDDTFD